MLSKSGVIGWRYTACLRHFSPLESWHSSLSNAAAAPCSTEGENLQTLLYMIDRALAAAARPLRKAYYRRQSYPFIHSAERNLRFELYPGEEIDRHIVVNGIYERRYLRFLESIIPDGAVILDIGANIGNHALYLSRKAAAVHCFEPNPRAWARLERNIALNNASNVLVHHYGLNDRNCFQRFTEVAGNLGMTRPSDNGELELELRKGDESVSLPRIDFIKIDVEGAEGKVLAGLKHTIAKHRPIIAFEYNGGAWEIIGQSLAGYSIVEPRYPRGVRAIARRGQPELVPTNTPEPRWYESLIALPDR